jgi:phenylpropionate dioxygenase-like ring-hydroxylating dioxygenase large terminal subunit
MPRSRSHLIDDREKGIFLLDRELLVCEDVLRQEMTNIFGKCWIYVGHGSEHEKPGDFKTPRSPDAR